MIFVVLLFSGNVMAFPFIEVEGFVVPHNASYSAGLTPDTTTVTGLEYSFHVTDDDVTGAEMNYLSLEFETAVFQSFELVAGSYDPSDWSGGTLPSASSVYLLSNAGTSIGVGERLSFRVNAIMYTAAFTDASLWQEGQVWAQSWFAKDTLGGGDGGSTAPVPEPATMLLLGTGLIGLAAAGRKKLRRA